MNSLIKIQELLEDKADCQARLNLLPYDGSPEIKEKGYISKMVNSRNRINEKIIFLHVSNTEEICDLMHSFLD